MKTLKLVSIMMLGIIITLSSCNKKEEGPQPTLTLGKSLDSTISSSIDTLASQYKQGFKEDTIWLWSNPPINTVHQINPETGKWDFTLSSPIPITLELQREKLKSITTNCCNIAKINILEYYNTHAWEKTIVGFAPKTVIISREDKTGSSYKKVMDDGLNHLSDRILDKANANKTINQIISEGITSAEKPLQNVVQEVLDERIINLFDKKKAHRK